MAPLVKYVPRPLEKMKPPSNRAYTPVVPCGERPASNTSDRGNPRKPPEPPLTARYLVRIAPLVKNVPHPLAWITPPSKFSTVPCVPWGDGVAARTSELGNPSPLADQPSNSYRAWI